MAFLEFLVGQTTKAQDVALEFKRVRRPVMAGEPCKQFKFLLDMLNRQRIQPIRHIPFDQHSP